jgi:hypothetical protein
MTVVVVHVNTSKQAGAPINFKRVRSPDPAVGDAFEFRVLE